MLGIAIVQDYVRMNERKKQLQCTNLGSMIVIQYKESNTQKRKQSQEEKRDIFSHQAQGK